MLPALLTSVALSLPIPLAPAAQEIAPEIEAYRERVERILGESVAAGRAYERLSELCRVAPHRLSGSPGFAAAAEWARQVMEADGLKNVRLEEVTVPRWVRGDVCELRFAAPAQLAGHSLSAIALGGSVGTPTTGVTAEIVEVKSFEELRSLGTSVAGKIVFYNRPFEPRRVDGFESYGGAVNQRTQGALEAAKQGAVAVVVRSMTHALDDVPHTGAMHYQSGVERIPACAVSTLGAERLAALLAAGEEVRLSLEQNCEWKEPVTAHNVVGEIVGSERPDEIVLVGGHLDAWDVGHGAHDDGSGCCHALETARLLKVLDLRPRRTVRVVLFTNEENGLAGGRTYRETHLDELPKHVMALESDSGGFTPRGFRSNANEETLAILREISTLLESAGSDTVTRGGGGADIGPMAVDGVVLVGFRPDGQRYFDYHHTEEDTIDKVHPRELNLGAGVIASMVYVVADLEQALPRNPVAGE